MRRQFVRRSSGHASHGLPVARESERHVAVLQLISVTCALVLGLVIALVGLAVPIFRGPGTVAMIFHGRATTLHGLVMVFLALVPGVPFALGRFYTSVRPGIEGRRGRFSSFTSLCLYWVGGAAVLASAVVGRFNRRLCFVEGYDAHVAGRIIWLASGVFLIGLAGTVNGLALFRSTQGLTASRSQALNAFVRLMCMSSLMQTIALPAWACMIALLLVERSGTRAVFDATRGGDPMVLMQLFWFYVQPAILASIVGTIGAITYFLERLGASLDRERGLILGSGLAFSIIGLTTWGIHLVGFGQSPLLSTLFSATNLLLLVPLAVPFSVWLAAMRQLAAKRRSALTGVAGVTVLLAIGLLLGLPVSVLGPSQVFGRTYFDLGQLHFSGAALCATILLLTADVAWSGASSSHAPGRLRPLELLIGTALLAALTLSLYLQTHSILAPSFDHWRLAARMQRMCVVALGLSLIGLGPMLLARLRPILSLKSRHLGDQVR